MTDVFTYLGEEDGASAAEYALILAIIGAAIAAAMVFLGGAIANAVNGAANCINGGGSNCTF
jgi:pilus assembly protein Flp/PilA